MTRLLLALTRAIRLSRHVPVLAALLVLGVFPASAVAERTVFRAQFTCNDRGAIYPLAGAKVQIRKRGWDILPKWFDDDVMAETHLDGDGRTEFIVAGDEDDYYLRVSLEDGAVRVEDWYALWAWYADSRTHENDVPVRDYGNLGIGNGTIAPECAVFEGARRAYYDYVDTIGAAPVSAGPPVNVNSPFGRTPFARHTSVHWPPRYPTGDAPGGFETSFHEFAHTIRHAFDGSLSHFLEDVVDFKYLQQHHACKRVSSSAFAFNEGWAEYWARDFDPAPDCPGIAENDYRVEGNVAAALLTLERRCPNVDRREMVDVLRRNPGRIHSFDQFRDALGCRLAAGLERTIGSADRDAVPARLVAIGKLQQQKLSGTIARLAGAWRAATREARSAGGCTRPPCGDILQRAIRPALIRAELGQARLLRKTLAFQGSAKKMKKLGRPRSQKLFLRLGARAKAFQVGSARLGKRALTAALRRAQPILRKHQSANVVAIGRALRTNLATFRSGRLPAGFGLPAPAGATLASAPPLAQAPPPPAPSPTPAPSPEPSPTPEPTPEPTPTPTPAPRPDLVVDRVYVTGEGSWTWNIKVRNAGASDAPASKTGLIREATDPVLIDTPALAAGATVIVKTACPYGTRVQATGRADATGLVDESNESNNDRASEPGGTDGRCRYP